MGPREPVEVRYVVGDDEAMVTYVYDRELLCGGCSAPTNEALPRGKGATAVFDARTHELREFRCCGP